MAATAYTPSLLGGLGGKWECSFYDDFSNENTLQDNWCHPKFKGWRENPENKWKWDGGSGKEIWWDSSSSYLVKNGDPRLNVLRVGVWSDWFHRQDRIATKQSFGYGYFESMVRFKGAECMHSAFWLLPDNIPDEPTAPDSHGCINRGIEIDVCEHRLCDDKGSALHQSFNTAVHYGGYGGNHKSCGWKVMSLPGACETWTVFGCLHDEHGIRWYVNGQEVNRANVHSPVPLHIYYSTEVTPGPCWSGKCCPKSYGAKDSPAGYVDVNWCGHWKRA